MGIEIVARWVPFLHPSLIVAESHDGSTCQSHPREVFPDCREHRFARDTVEGIGQVDDHWYPVGVIKESLGPWSGGVHNSLASSPRLDSNLDKLQDGSD